MSWLDRRVELRALLAGVAADWLGTLIPRTGVAADWLGTLITAPVLGIAFGVGPETADSRIQELLVAPEFIISATVHGSFFTSLGSTSRPAWRPTTRCATRSSSAPCRWCWRS